eukprot:TRINITY_DN24690_c0_g1_i2.p1 TRINITY_DN24690_c0_g1~~TRINITY_DN24690_c0_g1_i2.p1  ORF type:complete len:363 (+),score=73.19 TRINITY_DN24690_c0_g1_i2:63-1151(+)
MEGYEIGDVLGKGSYGCARLAKRRSDGETVVIKVLPTVQPKDMLAALREIKILGGLDHPNIVKYYASFEADCCIQIVTEYADAGDLSSLISKRRGRPPDNSLTFNITIQVLMALRYLHGNRILHRDLKPANIFLTGSSDGLIVKIGDFGVSTVLKSNTNLAHTFCGTLHYLSPEVCEDKPYNNKADVWAVGCCAYEVLTGKRAFDAKAMLALGNKIVNGSPDPLPEGVDEGLGLVIGLMLCKKPELRPNASKLLSHEVMRGGVGCVAKDLLDKEEYCNMFGKEIAKVKGLRRREDYQRDLQEMEAWAAQDIIKLQQQEQEDAISVLKSLFARVVQFGNAELIGRYPSAKAKYLPETDSEQVQ